MSSQDTLKYFGFIGHFSEIFLYIEYFCTRIRTVQREKLEGTTSSFEANTIVKRKRKKDPKMIKTSTLRGTTLDTFRIEPCHASGAKPAAIGIFGWESAPMGYAFA